MFEFLIKVSLIQIFLYINILQGLHCWTGEKLKAVTKIKVYIEPAKTLHWLFVVSSTCFHSANLYQISIIIQIRIIKKEVELVRYFLELRFSGKIQIQVLFWSGVVTLELIILEKLKFNCCSLFVWEYQISKFYPQFNVFPNKTSKPSILNLLFSVLIISKDCWTGNNVKEKRRIGVANMESSSGSSKSKNLFDIITKTQLQ